MNHFLPTLLLAALLVACSSAPPPPRPVAEESALRWNQRGEDAYRRGELREALAAYQEAHRLYASLDNTEAAAAQLLNLGTVQYGLGEREAAQSAFEQVFLSGAAVSSALRAEAAYRRARVELDSGNTRATDAWLEKSMALCRDSACATQGRAHNLRARSSLARADVASAETEARRALELNRRSKDVAEEANSLRLLAELAFKRRDYSQADAHFTQALALDRVVAEPQKIVRDLLGLAATALAQGRREAGADYARRARAAAEGIGEVEAMKEAENLLRQFGH